MKMERSHTTERILKLTLEIIYLLTGENYIAFKHSDGLITSNLMKTQIPVVDPPSHSQSKDKKIEEFTREIIALLAGEIPSGFENGAVSLSIKTWENLGHKDFYKDIMMENRPPLTSLDESKNHGERCPLPLYSQDSINKNDDIPQDDQDEGFPLSGAETRVRAEELYVRSDDRCKKEEEIPEISTNTIDTQEDYAFDDDVNQMMIKVEDTSAEISTDGQYVGINTENPNIYPDCDIEDEDIISNSTKENPITPSLHSSPYSSVLLSGPSTHEGWFSNEYYPTPHHEEQESPKSLQCPECGKCFSKRSKLAVHRRSHTTEKPFLCLECGKSFRQKSHLVSHHKTHSRVHPYSCSECGKCFSQKSNLIRHEKVHTGEKSFSCPQCGKRFSVKSNLLRHEKIHTGEKPYSCSECGRSFSLRANLIAHVRIHTGDKPFACSECGKGFSRKSVLIIHERVHTGEKPYSCTDCGKCFSKRFLLARHARLHSEQKSNLPPIMDLPKKPNSSLNRGLTAVLNRFCYQNMDTFHGNSTQSHVSLPAGDKRFPFPDVT